jgi:hypothetical protein
MTLLFLQIIDFPKFDPLTATGMALCLCNRLYIQCTFSGVHWVCSQPAAFVANFKSATLAAGSNSLTFEPIEVVVVGRINV